ncbi:fimbrial protein [Atlantibacter hermannii]|uniref:fimbrial protein n=1 Tax=Atlantibacter hermannii TaxID=565 RepID=UPI0028A8CE7C|nr:fimbrial protein [Atlantibacter hermannii]
MHTLITHGKIVPVILLASSFLLCASGSVWAEDCDDSSCKIEVQFHGTYVQDTCDISINNGSSSELVVLPTLSTAGLQQDGNEAGSRVFDIKLKGCPAGKTVMLQFASGVSEADVQTGNLVNATGSGYSSNVQIRIRKSNNDQMKIDDINTMQDYVIDNAGSDVTHSFLSSYYAKGANKVTAGLVHATASIELYYK